MSEHQNKQCWVGITLYFYFILFFIFGKGFVKAMSRKSISERI